jgi:hypothetical protein
MKRHLIAVVLTFSCLALASSAHVPAANVSPATSSYILKAWRIDGAPEAYLWSFESASDQESPGELYKSLSATALRARVGRLRVGDKLQFHFSGGGSFTTANAVTGPEFDSFRAFCAGKGIVFDFRVNTD